MSLSKRIRPLFISKNVESEEKKKLLVISKNTAAQ